MLSYETDFTVIVFQVLLFLLVEVNLVCYLNNNNMLLTKLSNGLNKATLLVKQKNTLNYEINFTDLAF